jgi:ketosteroid isomerase-like protein
VSGPASTSTTAEDRAAESAIRALIERWAAAVRAGDLDGVLADHADDIQMFDVPPPDEVRGIDAYRETWPPFFDWLRRGAVFEIVSLDVTAGADVAFATALLRCGTVQTFGEHASPAILLIGGAASSMDWWEDGFCERLASGPRFVTRYDLRDTGQSPLAHGRRAGAELTA